MIPRIKSIHPLDNFILLVEFDGGQKVAYDVKDDIRTLADFRVLETENGLFRNARLDSSRTCVYWTERVDLPSDTILEYGTAGVNDSHRTYNHPVTELAPTLLQASFTILKLVGHYIYFRIFE